MITPADVANDVLQVLRAARCGKGEHPHFLTAYQILERLPAALRQQLIVERGMPGSGAGVHHAAASVVKDAVMHYLAAEVEVSYIDAVGANFDIAGSQVKAGYPVCGIYRLRRAEEHRV